MGFYSIVMQTITLDKGNKMFKKNDKVIVCTGDHPGTWTINDNVKIGTFVGYNECVQGIKIPNIKFNNGEICACFGHVVSYSKEIMDRLSKLVGNQQFELLTAIKEWEGGKQFIVMRGLPGSGKSTKARTLAGKHGQVFSSDDFFCINDKQEYRFNANFLGQAHKWNQERALKALEAGIPIVVVDNTNTTIKELKGYLPHIKKSMKLGYKVSIEEPETPWRMDVNELVKKNTHGVPREVIQRMHDRYVKNVQVEHILF